MSSERQGLVEPGEPRKEDEHVDKPGGRAGGRIGALGLLVLLGLTAVLGIGAAGLFFAGKGIHDLLGENRQLKQAISNLTQESQIGYAKVLAQERREGRLFTRLLFVETDRADPSRRVLEREYQIEGDVVHFDALIVTFGNQCVMDGKERSLYLWRRVYGEKMRPEEGYAIETAGAEPSRYKDLCAKLSLRDRATFWGAIWELANEPGRLEGLGVKAIWGNAVYRKVRPRLIYVFKISNSGTLYPEVVPDL